MCSNMFKSHLECGNIQLHSYNNVLLPTFFKPIYLTATVCGKKCSVYTLSQYSIVACLFNGWVVCLFPGEYCTQHCNCDSTGTVSGTGACVQATGECQCKSGRYGDSCDLTCSEGCKTYVLIQYTNSQIRKEIIKVSRGVARPKLESTPGERVWGVLYHYYLCYYFVIHFVLSPAR